jgi:hypothetical protein
MLCIILDSVDARGDNGEDFKASAGGEQIKLSCCIFSLPYHFEHVWYSESLYLRGLESAFLS